MDPEDTIDGAWGEALAEQADGESAVGDDANLDDDDLGADWGAAFEEAGEDLASDWEAMVDDDPLAGRRKQTGDDRILNQDEIDNLLGFNPEDAMSSEHTGIRAIIESAMVSYERLPMLEIIFDRLVRLMTTSLRNFTSDNVEVSLDSISSVRFGDYLDTIPLPAMLSVFRAREWDNYGLLTVDSSLIYSVVDVLLGGRRGSPVVRVEGRPYTTIETNLIQRLVEVVLRDAELAFAPLSPVNFDLDRLETNPRFATISRAANAAILVRFRIDMEDRGGRMEILLPYATIEPIRELLLQMFMGEKFGRDSIWEGHLATEIYQASVEVRAVLDEMTLPVSRILNLRVGDTLMMRGGPNDPVAITSGETLLTRARIGRVRDKMAVSVLHHLVPSHTTMSVFESMEQPEEEAPVQ